MIYELRTYDMRPGSTEEFERRVEEALPHRTHLSPMAAFWHTSIGPLNQVVHIWPYEDLNARAAIRAEAARSPNWPPKTQDLILNMENVIIEPAPFAKSLEPAEIGPVFEIRIYTFQPGALPHVIEGLERLTSGPGKVLAQRVHRLHRNRRAEPLVPRLGLP